MIRTISVEMSKLKGIAYRQKLLAAGGAGITIMIPDDKAVFTINKRDGSVVPYGKVDAAVFTQEVVDEALELTRGLPYKRLGNITKVHIDCKFDETPAELGEEENTIALEVILSDEYLAFLKQYEDKNEKFSYQLMNKDLIQLASRSNVVASMIAEKKEQEEIVKYLVRTRGAELTKNNGLDDEMLTALIETMDDMDTRSAFKELRTHLRGKLSNRRN